MPVIHKSPAGGRWGRLPLMEQMGHIGSEVSRAISWHKKGNMEIRDAALERAIELFDLTIADPRWRNRLKEITRAREVVCDVFYGDNVYQTSLEALNEYFLQFGIAARLQQTSGL